MERSNINDKGEATNKLTLEMLKLIREQKAEINFLVKKLKEVNSRLLRAELEVHILNACLSIIGDKYNLSRQEKREIVLQVIEEIFPDIFL